MIAASVCVYAATPPVGSGLADVPGDSHHHGTPATPDEASCQVSHV